MPIYEYGCSTCGHKFEKLQFMNAPNAECPVCEQSARRAVSVFDSVSWGKTEAGLPNPLPPMGGDGCCGGGCGCGH